MRGLVWMKDEGAEYAEVNLASELTAVGVALWGRAPCLTGWNTPCGPSPDT